MKARTVALGAVAALVLAQPGPAATAPAPASSPSSSPSSPAIASRPHPRLVLAGAVRERLRQKAAARDPDWLAVLQQADRFAAMPVARYHRNDAPNDRIAYSYEGFGWLEAVTSLGIAYDVTASPRYARKVAEILREAAATVAAGNLEPITADSGFPSRSAALAVALGYDWVYAQLTPAERAAAIATLNAWFDTCRTTAFDRDGPAVSNYFGGHLLGFGAAGYATAGENQRAPEIIAYVRSRFEAKISPAFANGPFAGGYPIEGYLYGANHYQRLLEYMLMADAAEPGAATQTQTYATRIARAFIHALKPNRWQLPEEADYPGDTTGVINLDLPVLLAHHLRGQPIGAHMQHLVTHVGTPPEGVRVPLSPVTRLLYGDRTRPSADYATEPLYLHTAGDEHLLMRSSWASDAVWASFNGGLAQFSGHQARAAGHLAIQRGDDPLLVYAGQWKGPNGLIGQPQQTQTTSAYANTLFIDDGGDYLYKAERYLGGQSPFAEPRPLPFAQTADFSWARLDATPIYDRQPGTEDPVARSVKRFVRSFAYLAPATFVLFDHVIVGKPSYTKEIRFHVGGRAAPVVAGNLATATVGSSALHIRVLLPSAPAIRVAWNKAGAADLDPRIAISDSAPGTTLDALEVLAAGDRRAPAPAAALVRSDVDVGAGADAMLGAHVQAAGPSDRDRVALFAAQPPAPGAPPARVRYRVTPRGPSRHYLFDRPPGRSYGVRAERPRAGGPLEITVEPGGAGAIRSSDAGVLVFDVIGTEVRPVP